MTKFPGKIFQIGFNRCGTKSIALFFQRQGYRTAHWKRGTVAAAIELARLRGEPLLTYAGGYDVYTDMEKINVARLDGRWFKPRIFSKLLREMGPEAPRLPIQAFKYYAELDRQYPGSKFILNTRDPDRWVASRLRFNDRKYRSCIHGDGVHASEQELGACWKQEWEAHHRAVREHFSDRPDDLLVFDIEQDEVAKLIEFFAPTPLDPAHWGRENQTSRT